MKRTIEQRIRILEKKLELNESLIPGMPEEDSSKFLEKDIEFATSFVKKINSKFHFKYRSPYRNDIQIRLEIYSSKWARTSLTNVKILNQKIYVDFFTCSGYQSDVNKFASVLSSILGKPVSYNSTSVINEYALEVKAKQNVKIDGVDYKVYGVAVSYQKLLKILDMLKDVSKALNAGFADWYGNKKLGSGTID